ncbi:cullin-associated NEDD8-dissociated protein 1-like [Carica papaya]|uniref:cullin-associated NEDD8-dissociated protein 1-like n=1 Tax=Carica papaya TaxID=3649 RepID=UPI000B8CBAD9|nr:cullin-associated NEDD8-dissociated protein 1-like [Carica papaya]
MSILNLSAHWKRKIGLAPLVKKVSEPRVVDMTNKLCDKLLNGKDQNRDIASIALKTIVAEVNTPSLAQSILVSLPSQLIKGITGLGMSTEIKCECLDILCDVLHKFGNLMVTDHEALLNALLSQLISKQATVRKKTVSSIASLASSLSDDLLGKATVEVVRNLRLKGVKSEMVRTNIQMIGALSESANEYTDDEDVSWKVRRAAAKCLAAVIVSRPEMLSKLYEEACPKLIDRFKEREENVKMDVFNTFIELLRQTGNVTKGQVDMNELSPRWLLKQEVPKIVKSINRQLREKSVKTKVGAFSVLKELVVVLPDCLEGHIGSLIPGIEKALNDKSSTSNLKIEALVFTRLVLASHSPSVFHPYIKVIFVILQGSGFDFKPYVHPIYASIMSRLTNQDQDQEVKECAISCMGLVISTFGDNLRAELPSCLPVLVDRMGNEITRLTAVKAFAVIAASPLRVDLSCVLEHVIAELTAFLRKANRALRQATLGTLNSLIEAYGDEIGSSAYEVIIVELSTLISDSDLHMTALALELCCTLMADKRSNSNVGLAVRNKVLPQALTLIKSSLLQGQALLALQNFFAALVYSANTSFDVLLESLLACAKPSPQSGGVAKQALHSIAQCVAVLCLAAGDQKCSSTVKMLTKILKDDSSTNSVSSRVICFGLFRHVKRIWHEETN